MGAAELLGPHGPFAGALPGYEARAGQLEMTVAVERCLAREGIAMIEAGTGTGKTLAYLVPALLSATRKKIVISTATRALQDQIFHKDLPLADRVLGLRTPVALMKGLPNYVCRRRHHEFSSSRESLAPDWSKALPVVDDWLSKTETGRIDELATFSEDHPIWSQIAASSERRVGAGCRFFDSCFITAMKREAARARVVVVNHHLFFADLALRGEHPGSVIPDYDAVIFDEAHQLEEVATEHFGTSVSSTRLARLCNDARAVLERELGATVAAHARYTYECAQALFDAVLEALGANEGRMPLTGESWHGPVESAWFTLDTALEGLSARVSALGAVGRRQGQLAIETDRFDEHLEALARRAEQLRHDLASIKEGMPGAVIWFESLGRSRKLSASPVGVAPILQERLFDVIPSVVLTSATLSNRAGGADGVFDFQRQRLGLDRDRYSVAELCVASPFQFEEQALLYVPEDLPSPDEPAFSSALAERCLSLIEQSRGGAFVLTTSLKSMQRLHRALSTKLPAEMTLLVQGEAPKAALVQRFRAAADAVLVATLSFWQGVDVPGSALRLVILEKAPFPVPSDPIVLARSQALAEAGESPFARLHLPLAELILKQGFGRLIRTQSDYGVVALLDGRVLRRGYGRRLLEGLPPAPRVTRLSDVAAFWERRHGASAPARRAEPVAIECRYS